MVHADSEHRPRPPGGERSRFVSRSYFSARYRPSTIRNTTIKLMAMRPPRNSNRACHHTRASGVPLA
ncbi:hypothetical protein EYR05_20380 [Xanthomonas oryzae pv. oryzae]|nr:hypothetical protein C0L89_20215 [Xanthomonas oryzae pv. oryzae]QBI13802.1 hypothetical protein EYR02_20210 [Xanthomonas oryzae pv. oryzae]QBI17428.1 hypothetical protein EYR03_20570 [Xanthomonas oryzae pv. oryzae]QBN23671.1 hypothetical protein EBA00_02340 [Xanthomonas oryzae pv. oryzae]QBN33484.1 hypothetical protein EBA02_20170 [Xanthomonas oryzae pv. oryzae]